MAKGQLSVAACLAFLLGACSAEREGDAVALSGTGLVYRGGLTQVIDVSRHKTYGFVFSPTLLRWTSDDHLFRDKSANCRILVFDIQAHGTVVRTGKSTLVRADELSLRSIDAANAERRVTESRIEALRDSRVCASG